MKNKDTTRKNHYVPIWYQKGFLLNGKKKLHYHDLRPKEIHLPDGSTTHHRNNFESYPSQCFYETDLYSTFLGTNIDDKIEKKFFGTIDTQGAPAIEAFLGDNIHSWMNHFKDLFIYLNAQKLRTPKGLDWLRSRYSDLDQNALMSEMLEVQGINIAIWCEGVREIVSATNANVKFILTDHPVTIYNYACSPTHDLCHYPGDPSIALKSSQTLFPLNQNYCLILTNLEYAKEPTKTNPVEKRTFARPIHKTLVRNDKFIKQRELNDEEVTTINYVLKLRARRYIAAGKKEWLSPEGKFKKDWRDISGVLLPPKNELSHYDGEIFVGYEDGSVYYQDAYGRSFTEENYLKKTICESKLSVNDHCGCGSGRKYRKCCKDKPKNVRASWAELSIRERNLAFCRGISNILGTSSDIRQVLDEEKVKKIYEFYEFLWPIETDIFELLPKPDGKTRAIYSGLLDCRITPFALSNACLYFGDVLVQSPFIHPKQFQASDELNPVSNPRGYLTQTLKNILFLFKIYPWIESGHITLFPDPASIDPYLQQYTKELALKRLENISFSGRDKEMIDRIQKEETILSKCMLPRDKQIQMIQHISPGMSDEDIEKILTHLKIMREENPLAILKEGFYADGSQISTFQLVPNFELLLLIAQATGSFILTDSNNRWAELVAASHRNSGIVISRISKLENITTSTESPLCDDLSVAFKLLYDGKNILFRQWTHDLQSQLKDKGFELNEEMLLLNFEHAQKSTSKDFSGNSKDNRSVIMHFSAPAGGIYHNHVQRLILRCGIEQYQDHVSLAVYWIY